MEQLLSSPPIGLDLLPFLRSVKKELGLWKRRLHPQGELVDISIVVSSASLKTSTRVQG